MNTEQLNVLRSKIIEDKIQKEYICAKRPGFFNGWTLEDKEKLLALSEKDTEAIKIYQAEVKRRFPSGRPPVRADGSFDMTNYPINESAAAKVACDAVWAFVREVKQRSQN